MSSSSPPTSATRTRAGAYARACGRFFAWCAQRGLPLAGIRLFDVAA
jgi:hypothetical protein